MGIVRCCWKRWWTPPDFEEPATEPPTGSISGRPPDAVAWTESTKTTAEPSKTSTSIHWFVMPGNGYALIRPGNQIPLECRYRGRVITSQDIAFIRQLVAENPSASRRRLSGQWRVARHGLPRPVTHAASRGRDRITTCPLQNSQPIPAARAARAHAYRHVANHRHTH